MKTDRRRLILAFLALLLFGTLTACRTAEAEPPEIPKNTEARESQHDDPTPDTAETAAPVRLSLYVPEGPGTKDLMYSDHLEIYIEECETETADGSFSSVGILMYRELSTGNAYELDSLGYGSDHSYWDNVRLYPFTGIMGYDGFIFEHPVGAAYEAYDFYSVCDNTPILVAECFNTMYTADLDGDGQLELLSNYHNMGYLDLFWGTGYSFSESCSLNETARDFLGLRPGRDTVGLYIDPETNTVTAGWGWDPEGGDRQTETVDIAALWEWEKNRTEFWDYEFLLTAGGEMPLVVLRESNDTISSNEYKVEELQVYLDGELIQTIFPADLSYDGDHLFEGLYNVRKEFSTGSPVVQDFNFDGSQDLGLLAVDGFPHNVSYCYFLWDDEAGHLSTDFFLLFAFLELDEENRQIVETQSNGNDGYAYRYYQFDGSNRPVLVKQEVVTYHNAPVELGQIWCTTYELVDGEMVQTGRELREEH